MMQNITSAELRFVSHPIKGRASLSFPMVLPAPHGTKREAVSGWKMDTIAQVLILFS